LNDLLENNSFFADFDEDFESCIVNENEIQGIEKEGLYDFLIHIIDSQTQLEFGESKVSLVSIKSANKEEKVESIGKPNIVKTLKPGARVRLESRIVKSN
jgi:hypothetical protein